MEAACELSLNDDDQFIIIEWACSCHEQVEKE